MYNMHEKTMDAGCSLERPALPVTDSSNPFPLAFSTPPPPMGMPLSAPSSLPLWVRLHYPLLPWVCSYCAITPPLLGMPLSTLPPPSLCSITPLASPVGTLPRALSPLLLCVHFPMLLWVRFPLLRHPLSCGYTTLCSVTPSSAVYASLCSLEYASLCLSPHRATPDVEAIEELFTQTELEGLFP